MGEPKKPLCERDVFKGDDVADARTQQARRHDVADNGLICFSAGNVGSMCVVPRYVEVECGDGWIRTGAASTAAQHARVGDGRTLPPCLREGRSLYAHMHTYTHACMYMCKHAHIQTYKH